MSTARQDGEQGVVDGWARFDRFRDRAFVGQQGEAAVTTGKEGDFDV